VGRLKIAFVFNDADLTEQVSVNIGIIQSAASENSQRSVGV
jgi:hypothetical protein